MNEKLVQLRQRGQADRRRADRHLAADQRIKHPPGDDDDLSGVQFDEGDLIWPPALRQVLDHLIAEQQMPGVVNSDMPPDMGRMTPRWSLERKNWLFAGSDAGGHRAAKFYTLIETAKLNGVNPIAYMTIVLSRIADHPINRIGELLPWRIEFPPRPS